MTKEPKPVKSLMGALVGMMVGALVINTIEMLMPTLSEMLTQSKLKKINTKLDKIMKRHNPHRFTMMKAKRSCNHDPK